MIRKTGFSGITFCLLFVASALLFCRGPLFAQTVKINAFKKSLALADRKDSLDIIMNLLLEKNSMPGDSILKYVRLAESLEQDNPAIENTYMLNFYRIIVAQSESSLDQAISACDSNIRSLENIRLDIAYRLRFLHLKASLLVRKGSYEAATKEYFKLLELAQKEKNLEYQIAGKNGIGWVYMEKSEYQTAIDWFRKALSTTDDPEILNKFTVVLTNLAATFNSLHKNDSALIYVSKAISLAVDNEDLRIMANGYAIKADILLDLHKEKEAALALEEALSVRKKIGDIYYIISDMYQMGLFYANIGECRNGILICREGIALANKYKVESKKIILYEALAENYKACKDMASYARVLEEVIALKDSTSKAVSESALAEMSAKYNLESKEQKIVQQELMLSRRNFIIFGSLILFLLIGIIGLQYFAHYKSKQERKSFVDMARARDDERLRIAADLHDSIGSQLSFVSRKLEISLNKDKNDETALLEFLKDMDISVRKIISDLRETIWTMKKEKIDFSELSDRLKLFAQQQLSTAPQVNLHITEIHEKAISFSSFASIHLYRIAQEAINNAFIHANAKNITIRFISPVQEGWRIEICDDGRGFDAAKVYEEHYGLENMNQRAKSIQINLRISSTAESGTSVILSNRETV